MRMLTKRLFVTMVLLLSLCVIANSFVASPASRGEHYQHVDATTCCWMVENKKEPNKVIADISDLGTRGLVAYAAVELVYWSVVPLAAWLSIPNHNVASIAWANDAFREALKTPLLVALLLWPNSWIRNGIAVRLAQAFGDDNNP